MISVAGTLCLLLLIVSTSGEDCEWVKLKADGYILYQSDKVNEKYGKQSYSSEGKPVFKRHNGDEFMYWVNSTDSWMVGSTIGSTSVSLFTYSNDSHPADIPDANTWFVASGFFWTSYTNIRVDCTSKPLETWQIALIVVAVLLVVGILVGVCIYCINKKKDQNTRIAPGQYGGYDAVYYNAVPRPPAHNAGPRPPAYNQQYAGYGANGFAGAPPAYQQAYQLPGSTPPGPGGRPGPGGHPGGLGAPPPQHMRPRLGPRGPPPTGYGVGTPVGGPGPSAVSSSATEGPPNYAI